MYPCSLNGLVTEVMLCQCLACSPAFPQSLPPLVFPCSLENKASMKTKMVYPLIDLVHVYNTYSAMVFEVNDIQVTGVVFLQGKPLCAIHLCMS